jgi:hypothetical protein
LSEVLKENFEDLGVDERKLSKCILKKQGLREWTGFIWLRMGSSGRLL